MDQSSSDFEDDDEASDSVTECPTRQAIMDKLDFIETRMKKAIRTWEDKNSDFGGAPKQTTDRRRSSVPFPTGFGFFLADDTHIPPEVMEYGQECALGRLYDHIMSVQDRETQDRLLSFLDDYRAQREVLEKIKNNRIDLLQDIQEWMIADNAELQECESTHLYPAMTAETKFRECYMDTVATMDKLCQLKKELKKPVAKEHGVGGSSEDGQGTEASTSSSDSDQWSEELHRMVKVNKESNNKNEMDKISQKIEDIVNSTHALRDSIENMKTILEDKQEERLKLVEETENVRETNHGLAEEIKKMEAIMREKNQAAEQPPGSITPDTLTGKLSWWSTEAETQTSMECLQEEAMPEPDTSTSTNVGKSHRKRNMSIDKKARPRAGFTTKEKDSSITTSSYTDDTSITTTTQSTTGSTSKSIASQSRRGSVKKVPGAQRHGNLLPAKLAGLLQSSGLSEGNTFKAETMEDYLEKRRTRFKERLQKTTSLVTSDDNYSETFGAEAGVADYEQSSRESNVRESFTLSCSDREDSLELAPDRLVRMLTLNEEDVHTPVLSPEASIETEESLQDLVRKFVTNSVDHVKELQTELLAMRHNAREEIQKIKARGERLEEMESTLETLEKLLHEQSTKMPNLSSNEKTVAIVNRQPPDHCCYCCLCHKNTAETIVLTTQDDQKAVEETRKECRAYLRSLEKLKTVYTTVDKVIRDSHKAMTVILSELVWGELGTSGYSDLDTDVDLEFMELVDDMMDIPTDADELMDRAGTLVFGIEFLVKDIMTTLDHTTIRMADVKWQNTMLDKLEQHLFKARHMIESTALEMARARAREKFLATNTILNACVCSYCICYNSPFEDGTRTRMGEKGGELKNDVIHCISSVSQMMKMVVTTVDMQHNPLLSGVHPEVLGLMETATNKLFSVLETCLEQGEED